MVIPWRRYLRHDGDYFARRRVVIQRCVANIHAIVGPAQRSSYRAERLVLQLIAAGMAGLLLYVLFIGFTRFPRISYREAARVIYQDSLVLTPALDSYWMKNREFPTEDEGLSALPNVKLSDPWGNPYLYQLYNGGQGCRITSLGADGVRGGLREDADLILYDDTKYTVR